MSFFKNKKILKDNDINFKCCHDEKNYKSTLELIPHFKMVTPTKKIYICRVCGEIFERIKK